MTNLAREEDKMQYLLLKKEVGASKDHSIQSTTTVTALICLYKLSSYCISMGLNGCVSRSPSSPSLSSWLVADENCSISIAVQLASVTRELHEWHHKYESREKETEVSAC
jgi:hypothetical protein